MLRQKFHFGDAVRIAKELGPSMRHFQSDCVVVIIGSFLDLCGSTTTEDKHTYGVMFPNGNRVSWYKKDQLTLIRNGGPDAVEAFRQKVK